MDDKAWPNPEGMVTIRCPGPKQGKYGCGRIFIQVTVEQAADGTPEAVLFHRCFDNRCNQETYHRIRLNGSQEPVEVQTFIAKEAPLRRTRNSGDRWWEKKKRR